jgi:hypothetical protein
METKKAELAVGVTIVYRGHPPARITPYMGPGTSWETAELMP